MRPRLGLKKSSVCPTSWQQLFGNGFTTDTTAKTGSSTGVVACDRFSFAAASFTGRGTANDEVFLWNCNFLFGAASVPTFTNLNGPILPNNEGVSIVGTRFRGLAFAGTTTARIQGGEQVLRAGSTIAITGATSILNIQGCDLVNPLSAVSGAVCTISGSYINAALSGAGTFDVRSSNYVTNTNLTGITGTCARSNWTGTTGSTSIGANTITLTPAYPAGSYNVHATQVSGTPTVPTIDTKAGGSFVLHDATGTDVFDYTVVYSG